MRPLTERQAIAHCRICGYTPRPPRPGDPDYSFEKIVNHIELRHPMEVWGVMREMMILDAQENGDDSQCQIHGVDEALELRP